MAHMRYLIWGEIAEKEGFSNVARLFRAIAYAEQVHATNHFHEIGGKTADATVTAGGVFGSNKTADNLQGAINGELHEVEQMYPVYLNAAEFQNEALFPFCIGGGKDTCAALSKSLGCSESRERY